MKKRKWTPGEISVPSQAPKIWSVTAPSNIALIKYMGKVQQGKKNFPSNSSLSVTLGHLRTRVDVQKIDEPLDRWQSLNESGWNSIELSEVGRERFIDHWKFLKDQVGMTGSFLIRSANNFASDCGLASSASSFAALTLAAKAVVESTGRGQLSRAEWANLSRQGSGSSCRSFFAPLVLWQGEEVREIETPYGEFLHQVVVVDAQKKTISSSEAHQRVVTSSLNTGRSERAEQRLERLLSAFQRGEWRRAYEIMWAEFWDMHALFETSQPPFGYMLEGSLRVLNEIRKYWREAGDGPLVTMDAGANIHLLYRRDQQKLFKNWQKRWSGEIINA